MKKLLYLILTVLIVGCSTDDDNNNDNSTDLQKEWLYTHTSLDATATNSTTIVIPLTGEIFAFTDRPNREYKYISGDEFASYWNDYDDENSFKLDPPNAVLTWVDEDGVEEVEVVITDADFDGTNIIYTIENTTITANQSFEDVSLFVDGNGSSNNVYLASNGITVKASAPNNCMMEPLPNGGVSLASLSLYASSYLSASLPVPLQLLALSPCHEVSPLPQPALCSPFASVLYHLACTSDSNNISLEPDM